MSYRHQFIVGQHYRRRDGRVVKIIAENEKKMWPHYRCVQADDGEDRWEVGVLGNLEFVPGRDLGWRYDRSIDVGRCTAGSNDNPHNLVPGSIEDEESHNRTVHAIGLYHVARYAESFKQRGVFQTAKNARKQGIDILVVLSALRLWK